MKLQTQRFIDRWAGQVLCGAVSAWVRFTGLFASPARIATNPKNILVILLSEMGSIVLAGPMFAALRQRHPGATLHVLQLRKNQEVSLLLGLAEQQQLHALDDSSQPVVAGPLRRAPVRATVGHHHPRPVLDHPDHHPSRRTTGPARTLPLRTPSELYGGVA